MSSNFNHQNTAPQEVLQRHNVLIFGETGVGKSTIINMLAGRTVAPTSDEAQGCTPDNTFYDVSVSGTDLRLWDTAGMNEAEGGTVGAAEAERKLIDLVGNELKGAVTLLVYCIRGVRFRRAVEVNYNLIFTTVCRTRVPIVLIVTGLENEDPMEAWWTKNKGEFVRRGLNFSANACITTTKGKKLADGSHLYDKEFAESQNLVTRLVLNNYKAGNIMFTDVNVQRKTVQGGLNAHDEDLGRLTNPSMARNAQSSNLVRRDTGGGNRGISPNVGVVMSIVRALMP